MERAIDSIGWQRVKQSGSWLADYYQDVLTPSAGLHFAVRADAVAEIEKLRAHMRSAQGILRYLEAAPGGLLWAINLGGEGDRVTSTREALTDLLDGFRVLEDQLIEECRGEVTESGQPVNRSTKTRGQPRKLVARRLADFVAEIYFLGTGAIPPVGSERVRHDTPSGNTTTREHTSDYLIALQGVYDALGVTAKAMTFGPDAKKKLSPNRQRELLIAYGRGVTKRTGPGGVGI